MLESQNDTPGLGDFIGIAWAQSDQAGHRAKTGQLFNRLMRRTILTDADRVVREDVECRQFHDRRQPDRIAHIVGEDQEARTEGPELGECHAVRCRTHSVLADPEMKIAAAMIVRLEVTRALECHARLRRWREIRRAADEPRQMLRNRILDLARGVAASDSLGIGRKGRNGLIPARR